jgi:hypothetical protein
MQNGATAVAGGELTAHQLSLAAGLSVSPLSLPDGLIPRSLIEAEYRRDAEDAASIQASAGMGNLQESINAMGTSPASIQAAVGGLRPSMLREYLYTSSWANIFENYKLKQGELPYVSLDTAVPAQQIGFDGLPEQVEITSGRYIMETNPYGAIPYVRWPEQSRTLYDLLNATQQRGKASLMLAESTYAYTLARYSSGLRSGQGATAGLIGTTAASQNAPTSVISSVPGYLSFNQLSNGLSGFGGRLTLKAGQMKLAINPQRISDLMLLSLNASASGNILFVPAYNDDIIRKSFDGKILGMTVYSDIVIPQTDTNIAIDSKGVITGTENLIGHIFGGSEVVGLRAIRTDLMIESMRNPGLLADVFAIYMDTGFLIAWVKGVQRLTSN